MRVCESFESLQGEGALMGRPMLFIRLGGCNLACEWCDTAYARESYETVPVETVETIIRGSSLRHVCWTGGEPLLQREEVCAAIARTPERLHCLETNGTIPVPDNTFFHVTASPKDLASPPVSADVYKFVVAGDMEERVACIMAYAEAHNIPKEKIFLQPECISEQSAREKGAKLWDLCVREGVSLSPRMHILLFGSKRGV
jgi:organic radical activating enzyme